MRLLPSSFSLLVALCSLVVGASLRADSTAPAGTVETLPASSPYGQATAIRNVPYVEGGGLPQTFDLYLPRDQGGRPVPFVVWMHGGAWSMASKEWDEVKYLVKHGYAIATVDYRLTPKSRFPAQIQDCNAALSFLVAHAGVYGLDPKRFVVAGSSAGGHLALMLGLARHEKAFGGDPDLKPLAILDFFGPADLNRIMDDLQAVHSDEGIKMSKGVLPQFLGALPAEDPAMARAASPLTYVAADAPPVLILHGNKDATVPLAQSERLHARLDEVKVRNELGVIEGAPHGGPMFSLPEWQAKVLDFLHGVMP